MNDLISRQAAIDAVHKEFDDCIVWDESGMTTANEVEKILDSVPSAQHEITRCKDCKYGSPNGQYGCKCYHYQLYETHEMYEHDFCSRAERRTE